MADERSSGYFWDVQKWKGSTSTRRMSFVERGVYREILDHQWEKGRVPDDAELVADALAINDAQRAEILAAWPVVCNKFVQDERRPGFIFNVRLERTRRQQRANWRKKVEAGRAGGKASAGKRAALKVIDGKHRSSDAQALSTDKTRQDVDVDVDKDVDKTRPDLDELAQAIDRREGARLRKFR